MTPLKELSNLKYFAARIAYCKENFEYLGAGTSRIVFRLDGNIVLKLAKNAKGVAQNRVEADRFLRNNELANSAIDADPNDIWIITKLAKRITPSQFKTLTGVDFKRFYSAINHWWGAYRGQKLFPPSDYNEIKETDIFQDTTELMGNMEINPGDFEKISSWGEIDGKIKIIDFGATKSVLEEFYSR
jgi:hypothetical protein